MEKRCCPECKSVDYRFRSRKKIETENGKSQAVETKYRCQGCRHEWRELAGMTKEDGESHVDRK
jgi:rubredoxin